MISVDHQVNLLQSRDITRTDAIASHHQSLRRHLLTDRLIEQGAPLALPYASLSSSFDLQESLSRVPTIAPRFNPTERWNPNMTFQVRSTLTVVGQKESSRVVLDPQDTCANAGAK